MIILLVLGASINYYLFMEEKKKFIIVLGMHRSGTSCLMGCLQEMGVNIGDEIDPDGGMIGNDKGHKENFDIISLNNEILAYNGGHPIAPSLLTTVHYTQEHAQRRDQILEQYISLEAPYVGFKDPRTLINFNFWEEGLEKIKDKVDIQLVGTFRNPHQVVNSILSRRKKLLVKHKKKIKLSSLFYKKLAKCRQEIEEFENKYFNQYSLYGTWNRYNLKLLEAQEKYQFPILHYGVEDNEYINNLKLLYQQLFKQEYKEDINFFDANLFNEAVDNHEFPCNEITQTYNNLCKIAQTGK